MLWLAAYLTGFPPAGLYTLCWTHGQALDASMYRAAWMLMFQCPLGLELLLIMDGMPVQRIRFNALSGLSCYDSRKRQLR